MDRWYAEIKKLEVMLSPKLRNIWEFCLKISGINLIVFGLLSVYFGGDALAGEVRDGKYYLAMKGNLVEVSEFVFLLSKYHGLSVSLSFFILLGLPLTFAALKAFFNRNENI